MTAQRSVVAPDLVRKDSVHHRLLGTKRQEKGGYLDGFGYSYVRPRPPTSDVRRPSYRPRCVRRTD